MEPTLSIVNVRKSIMRYFIDELETRLGVKLVFDKWVAPDYFETQSGNKWVFINFGDPFIGTISDLLLTIICYTKSDPEGVNLSKLQDNIIEVTKNESSERTVIPFYDTTTTPSWTEIGGIILQLLTGGSNVIGDNGVNMSVMNVKCLWAAKA